MRDKNNLYINQNHVESKSSEYVYSPIFLVTLLLISLQLLYPFKDLLPNYIQIFVFFLWLVLLRPNMKCFKDVLFSKTFGIYMIFVVVGIRVLLSGNLNTGFFDPIKLVIDWYQIIVAYSLYLYVRTLSDNRRRKLVKFSLNCIFISLLLSLYYVYFVDPQAIRNTQRGFLFGVGDFQLMYGLVIFVGSLTAILRTKITRKARFKLTMLLMLSSLTLFKSNLVTSLILGIFSIFLNYLLMSKNLTIKKILVSTTLIFIVLVRDTVAQLFFALSRWDKLYWSTQNKIAAIGNLLIKSDNIDTLGSRWDLAQQSINSFFSNPIFGVNYSDYGQGVIGMHSQWADDLARFGLFGFLFVLVVGLLMYLEMIRAASNHLDYTSVKAAWLTYIVLGFLNPNMMGALLIIMFVIAPFISSIERTVYNET